MTDEEFARQAARLKRVLAVYFRAMGRGLWSPSFHTGRQPSWTQELIYEMHKQLDHEEGAA